MPRISKCCVQGCENNSAKTTDVSFHNFPKDLKMKKIWTTFCRQGPQFNEKFKLICSDHFIDSDFQRNYKAELLNTKEKRQLHPNGNSATVLCI